MKQDYENVAMRALSAAAPIRAVVLDFDGTLTDVEAIRDAYFATFVRELAAFLEKPVATVEERFVRAIGHIEVARECAAWCSADGVPMASASADPFLESGAAAQEICDGFAIPAGEARRVGLSLVFRRAFDAHPAPFRRDAHEVLTALVASHGAVDIVSNSDPSTISARLLSVDVPGVRVHGDARKIALADATLEPAALDALPSSTTLEGLARPIHLRRGAYHDALVRVMRTTGATASELLIAGDVFELDLALPSAMGAAIHLLTRTRTPRYERAAAAEHPRGGQSEDLSGILRRLAPS